MLEQFIKSPVISNLIDKGELPSMDVNVSIRSETLVDLFAGAFFTAVAVLLIINLLKKI